MHGRTDACTHTAPAKKGRESVPRFPPWLHFWASQAPPCGRVQRASPRLEWECGITLFQRLLMFSYGEPRPLRQLPTVLPCFTGEGNFLFPQANSSSHIQICSSRRKCWWPVISWAPEAECVPKAWVLTCCSPLAKTTSCVRNTPSTQSMFSKYHSPLKLIDIWGFPDSSVGKQFACNVGDLGLIPGLGRSPGEGKGYPLQYSGLENSVNCIVHGVAKSWTQLSDFH